MSPALFFQKYNLPLTDLNPGNRQQTEAVNFFPVFLVQSFPIFPFKIYNSFPNSTKVSILSDFKERWSFITPWYTGKFNFLLLIFCSLYSSFASWTKRYKISLEFSNLSHYRNHLEILFNMQVLVHLPKISYSLNPEWGLWLCSTIFQVTSKQLIHKLSFDRQWKLSSP